MRQKEGKGWTDSAETGQAGMRTLPRMAKASFIMAIFAAASVSWSLCWSFSPVPHPSFQQGEVLSPAHFVVPS